MFLYGCSQIITRTQVLVLPLLSPSALSCSDTLHLLLVLCLPTQNVYLEGGRGKITSSSLNMSALYLEAPQNALTCFLNIQKASNIQACYCKTYVRVTGM